MGIARGTNVVRDNLVFGYDTGYGVSDNNTTTRFYPGRNTVNHLSSGVSGYNVVQGAAWEGATPTFTLGTSEFGTPIGTYTIGSSSYMYSYDQVLDDDLSTLSSKNVTFSIYLKRRVAGNARIRIYDNVSGYTSLSQSLTTEFQRYTVNKTLGANPTRIFVMIDNTGGGIIDFHSPQLEIGVASPFVDGTRSATASLIDLKRTTDIDLSNVSFDSTGQPQYDGTDDYIDLANNPQTGDTKASWEFVVKFNQTHDDDTSTYRQLYIQEASVWIGQYFDYIGLDIRKDDNNWFDGDGGRNTTSKIGPVDANIWYHVVFTFNNGVMKGYLNGVIGFTTTKSGMTQGIKTGTTPRRIGRRSGQPLDGDMPVVRLYDADLSADEVTQNYKAYKNRFNI